MTSVFIVRPFGKKRVATTEGRSVEVDFDAIDRALIKPALAATGLGGETTEVIAAAGNIRVDMPDQMIASAAQTCIFHQRFPRILSDRGPGQI